MLINGRIFAEMLVSAANALDNNQTAINNMNVFPVPDGDTGINMTLTLGSVRALEGFEGNVSDCSAKMAPTQLLYDYPSCFCRSLPNSPERRIRQV